MGAMEFKGALVEEEDPESLPSCLVSFKSLEIAFEKMFFSNNGVIKKPSKFMTMTELFEQDGQGPWRERHKRFLQLLWQLLLPVLVAFTNAGHTITVAPGGQFGFFGKNGASGSDGEVGGVNGADGVSSKEFYFENNGVVNNYGIVRLWGGTGGKGGTGASASGSTDAGNGGNGGDGGSLTLLGSGRIVARDGAGLGIIRLFSAGSYGGNSGGNGADSSTGRGGDGGSGGNGGDVIISSKIIVEGSRTIYIRPGLNEYASQSFANGGSAGASSGGIGGNGGEYGVQGDIKIVLGGRLSVEENGVLNLVSGRPSRIGDGGDANGTSSGGNGGNGNDGGDIIIDSGGRFFLGNNVTIDSTIYDGENGGDGGDGVSASGGNGGNGGNSGSVIINPCAIASIGSDFTLNTVYQGSDGSSGTNGTGAQAGLGGTGGSAGEMFSFERTWCPEATYTIAVDGFTYIYDSSYSLTADLVIEGSLSIYSTFDNVVAFTNDGHSIIVRENGVFKFKAIDGGDGGAGEVGGANGSNGQSGKDLYFENNGTVEVYGDFFADAGWGGKGALGGHASGAVDAGNGGHGGQLVCS